MPERVLVWVLCRGGGVENVSVLISGSKGELDGEGEGVWTFIGNVKARGVGEITLMVTGSATATSGAWKVSGGRKGWTREHSRSSFLRACFAYEGEVLSPTPDQRCQGWLGWLLAARCVQLNFMEMRGGERAKGR